MESAKNILFFYLKQHVFSGALILFLITGRSYSQSLYIPVNIQKAIDKGTRTLEGIPGNKYWQNFADYNVSIRFKPKNRLVSGSATITYLNNSPDTLRRLVMRLYPNYYKKGFLRDRPVDPADESDGVTIDDLHAGGIQLDVSQSSKELTVDGTIATIRGIRIAPGQKSTVEITWHYTLNKGSHNRMGEVSEGSYFLGYAFPRIAVYDDVRGWDVSQYAGRNEPYFDFGNFEVSVSIPKDYVVWATGELQNAGEVFQPDIAAKYKAALASDQVTNIIDSAEADKRRITAKSKWNTFKFKAEYVPDFAIATSNHYIWQACGIIVDSVTGRRALVNSAFDKDQKDFFDVLKFSRKTVEVMSFDFPGVPYPYPHITVFEGLDQMEYPMMVNDNPIPDHAETIELTDHEIIHTYFPFYMGTNQTNYAWMDEGWATIGEWYISPKIDSTLLDEYGVEETRFTLGKETDVPLIIPSSETEEAYFVNAYPKPGFIYMYLKDMLGDSLFKKALHHYMDVWHGKHPLPWDFFYAMNAGSGKNLDWYWKAWFYDYGKADLAISSVQKTRDGYDITIEAKGNKPLPVYCEIKYTDSSREKQHVTVAVWENKNIFVLHLNTTKTISEVSVTDPYVPDVNEKDNVWKEKQ
jgi:hypothetical protein